MSKKATINSLHDMLGSKQIKKNQVWEGEGGGVQKLAIWGDFQGITGVTRGGRGVQKLENWDDVIYGWSPSK